ncbi:unnamed protein product [Closterium sp. Naga37s-1]|nr:unnamed protein product [Closterium sp. Naga37s-1]
MSLIATIPVARSSAGPFAPRISPPFRVRLRNPPLNPTFRLSLSARITFRAWQPFPRIPPASAASRVGAIRNSPPAPFGAFRSWRIRLSATAEAGGAAEAESAPGSLALPAEGIQERRREAAGEEGEGTGFWGEGTGRDEEGGNGEESAEGVSGEGEGGEEEGGEEGGEGEGGEEGEEGEGGEDWVRMAATEERGGGRGDSSNRGEVEVCWEGGEEGGVMAATEDAVGICCSANDLPNIHGVLKQRFADFIVNEVAPDGTVVHLTHLHVPPALLAQEQQAQQQARRREAESLGELVDAQGVLAQLRQALGGSAEGGGGLRDEEDARKLLQLLEGIKGIQLWWKEKKRGGEEDRGEEGGEEGSGEKRVEGSVQGGEGEGVEAGKGAPPPMPEPVVFAASADKAYRAAMHAFIKSYPFLVSDTIDAPQGPPYRCVRLRFLPPPALNLKGAGGRAGERGGRGEGGQRGGDGRGWREGRWGGKRGGRGGKWGKRGREEWEGGDKKRGRRDGGDGDGEDRGEGGNGGEGEGRGGEQGEEDQPAFDRRGRKGADGVPATTARRFLMCVPWRVWDWIGLVPRVEGEQGHQPYLYPSFPHPSSTPHPPGSTCRRRTRTPTLPVPLFPPPVFHSPPPRFHVLKENKDTNEAMALVGRYLGVQSRALGFSGSKDKRAVTVQRVTVSNQSARKVASLNAKLFGIRVGDYRLVDQPLVLGQLAGNRFIVTLRAVRASSLDAITAAAEGLRSHGIINYFGLQRFGVGPVATHTLSGLKRNPRNLVQALGFIPRTMRLMYVHSFQIYLWNHAASHLCPSLMNPPSFTPLPPPFPSLIPPCQVRAQLSELPVEPCRLTPHQDVWLHPSGGRLHPSGSSVAAAAAAAAGRAAGVGAEGPGMRGTDAEAEAEEAAAVAVEARAEGEEVRVVSEEEAERGVYSIDQVVLPLPGCSIQYPTNSTAEVFHSLAAKDGIDLYTSKHSVKEYSIERIPGGYRRLLQRPSNYNWRVLAYWRPTQVLAETDLDRIAAAALATPAPTPATSAAAPVSAAPPAAPSVDPAADSNSTASAAAAAVGAASTDAPAASASGDAAATSGSDAPAVVEAAHLYYGFKQPGYKGALKQAQRGEEKAGVTAGAAALSGVEAATGEAGAGGEAAGTVPAVVVLASSDGVKLGRDELERLGIGEGPIGALVEGVDGGEGERGKGGAEAGAVTEEAEKAEGIVESETEKGEEEGGDEKEVKQGELDAAAGSGEGEGQVAGRRGERGVEGAAHEGVRVALQVEFTLPASGYATMAIRELLKSSTAVSVTNDAGVHKVFNDREDGQG